MHYSEIKNGVQKNIEVVANEKITTSRTLAH